MTWEEEYAFEKFLPILARWQVWNYTEAGLLKAERIKKVRNPKGVASYEIIWMDPAELFKGLVEKEKQLSTIEPQDLVEKAYPDLVEAFKQSKIKPRKRKKAGKSVEELGKMLRNTSISEPKTKWKKIDSYLKKAVINNYETNGAVASTPVKTKECLSTNSSFIDDNCDDADLSDIVNEIIQQKPFFSGSFFINEPTQDDAFEATFEEMCARSSEESSDKD